MRPRRALLAAIACVVLGCRAQPPPRNATTPDAGLAIAIYAGNDGYAVVDDRRWIEVTGSTLLLANIDPGAELASLVIEPATRALHIGACTREPLPEPATPPAAEHARARFAPVVTCAVTAPPGRYLVRLVYVTQALGYRAQHAIELRDGSRAQVTSRFAVATPRWHARANVVLYDGVPGGQRSPRELVRGRVVLDGSTAILALPSRDVAARLRRVFEGAVVTSPDSTEPSWGRDSVQAVWVWLELDDVRLAPGPIHVRLDLAGEGVRDLDVPTPSRRQDERAGAPLRLPLWVDESLRGSRQRIIEYNDGASLSERYLFGIANSGDDVREVFIDEPLRKATRRRLDRAWPRKPTSDGNTLRSRLEIRPGRIERTGYTLTYEF